MFDTNLLISFAFMALLFLRQVYILKQPNKINYAPLMIGIGAIASLIHIIIHPEITDVLLLLRESLLPLLVALLLYIIMNIIHQTQVSETARSQEKFAQALSDEIVQLKAFIQEIEERMIHSQEIDRESQTEIRSQFKEDIKALGTILSNQTELLARFDSMQEWHKEVTQGFTNFTNIQLPELDNVVHKHIDILRVAEQDHYNKLNTLLEKAGRSRNDISEDMEQLKSSLQGIKTVSNEIANTIIKETLSQLSGVTNAFEGQIISLKSHSEGVATSISEGERTLEGIRTQSEMIMKQMILSSSKMQKIQGQNSELGDVFATLKEVIEDMESVRSDYVKSQAQLMSISKELAESKDKEVLAMRTSIEALSQTLESKIEESLSKLHEHYHIAEEEVTQSVQMLSKIAKSKSGYGEN